MRNNLRLIVSVLAGLCSTGLMAQVTSITDGYYRIKNAATRADGKQYVYVTGKYEAQPNATHDEAVTLPGTVIHLNVADTTINAEAVYNVKTLRSQGVDVINGYLLPALDKVRTELKAKLKEKLGSDALAQLAYSIFENDVLDKWDLNMHMKPVTTSDGRAAYYAYATVPSMQPLVDFWKTWGPFAGGALDSYPNLKAALERGDATATWKAVEQLAYGKIVATFGADNAMTQLVKGYIDNDRIHNGMTYYLISGGINKVDTNQTAYDPNNPTGTAHNEYDGSKAEFDFANNNADNYWGPELPAAGDAGMWILEKVDADNYFSVKPSAKMKGLNGKYYTTLYTDFPFQIVGDMTAYTIEGVNEKDANGYAFARVKSLGGAGTVVPAQTAVVLECPSENVADNQLLPTGTEEPATSSNRLCGNFFATAISGMTATDGTGATHAVTYSNLRAFNISTSDAKNPIGFYKVSSSVTTIPGNKAFLVLTDAEAQAKGFYLMFEDGSTTGIEQIETPAENLNHAVIYDLQGRRVTNPGKGIYIVNGKKVIIK